MDTKLKSSKSKYIISIIMILIIIGTSVGVYSTYPRIKEESKNYKRNFYEDRSFLYNLNLSNYGLYFDMQKNKEELQPSDIVAKEYLNQGEKERMEYDKKSFDAIIRSFSNNLSSHLRNIDYYAIKKDSNLEVERNGEELKALLDIIFVYNYIDGLKAKYSFYTVIDYDASGKRTIKELYGADLSNVMKGLEENDIVDDILHGFQLKPIENMTYIYAIPKTLSYKDDIFFYNERFEINSYGVAADPYITIASILLIVFGLILPYKISKEVIGFKRIAALPFELVSVAIIVALAFIIDISDSIIMDTIKGDLVHIPQLHIDESVANGLINILIWSICFAAIFLGVIMLKHILKTGIRQYLKDKSLIYKFFRGISRRCKRFYIYCTTIDLKDDVTKKLRRLLGINLIILTIMSCLWFFGIFAAIIYTIILFVMIKKRYAEISNKYNILLSATQKLAEGNLDIVIEEDLGVFNSFKNQLQSIQKGFKKAVLEEVKSQNMKTELISNVSHDLKTPLTSIITYVDLLKDEKLSEEKRKEYLDTLDRKSQRLQELIEDLFEVSKAASGNINLNVVDVDVVSLMKQTLLELEDKILKASLIIKTNYSEEKVILPLDSQRMYRVFENLVINITKYSMPSSRVYIDIISIDDTVQIILRNMSANEIEGNAKDLSERFVRGDKARSTEGSGLGLAIAKSFVELQGGQLDISVDGDLFKVVITFPQKIIK